MNQEKEKKNKEVISKKIFKTYFFITLFTVNDFPQFEGKFAAIFSQFKGGGCFRKEKKNP